MTTVKLKRRHQFAFAGLVLALLYGVHFFCCARSPLIQIPLIYQETDMSANLLWARSILDQGWLNPQPYHPYNSWMQLIGTREEWLQWWGGGAIFQQSPLYAYFLAGLLGLSGNLLYVHLLQTLLGMGFCVLIGLIANRVADDVRVGWAAFALAALYSPFYAYSWPLLRDLLGWIITAIVLLLLLELDRCGEGKRKRNWLAGAMGLALGIGYLARETFLLIIPLMLMALAIAAVRRRNFMPLIWLICGLGVMVSPLLVRNAKVGAPLFSSSNRFAEGFMEGNAYGTIPNQFVILLKMRGIFERSGGRTVPVVVETIRTHPNAGSYLRLQALKAVSLFDPYEPCDNLNLYFMENISPPVRWGLKHWMVIVPGLGGLILSLRLKDRRQFWFWLLFLPLLAGVLIGTPLSRYRQSLALLWIPWAAIFLVALWKHFHQNRRTFWIMMSALVAGWAACLTVFNRTPRSEYERPGEYRMMIQFYEHADQTEQAEAMKRLFREKFPGQEP
jgi:4-amino-4-deoxy-L-arabinose transferase-like glycosyltransferase